MIICKNCNADIPPQWVAAINSGICPGCGGEIFMLEDKELLDELRAAMQEMEEANAESIAGWLLSNYKLNKIGTAEPTKFHQKPADKPQDNYQPPANMKIPHNPVHDFLKRSGHKGLENRKSLKDLANEINTNAQMSEEDYGDYEDPNDDFTIPAEYEPVQPMAKNVLSNNSLLAGNGPPLAREEEAAIRTVLSGEQEDDLHPALQLDRMKRLEQQRSIQGGKGRGGFGRSG